MTLYDCEWRRVLPDIDAENAFHSGREWRDDGIYCRTASIAEYERMISGDAR